MRVWQQLVFPALKWSPWFWGTMGGGGCSMIAGWPPRSTTGPQCLVFCVTCLSVEVLSV